MNNLEITVTIIAIAVAQALTILLTLGRERDIKELRELVNELREVVDEQRLRIVELMAWLAGRNAAKPSRIRPEREPISEPIANNIEASEPTITPKDLPDTIPSTTEDGLRRATKAFKWFKDADEPREIVEARKIVAGLKGGAPPEPAITPKDLPQTIHTRITEDDDAQTTKADWSRDILAGLRAGLKGSAPPEPAISPKDLPDTIPSTTEDELKRANKAINWLKEESDKAREIDASLHGAPPEKIG